MRLRLLLGVLCLPCLRRTAPGTELYAAFGSTGALTTYLNNLVDTGSTIYQRDLKTTLTIRTVHI